MNRTFFRCLIIRNVVRSICFTQLFLRAAFAQTALTFDAATVKKAVPQEFSSGAERKAAKQAGRILRPGGGPGTKDPGRIRYPSISLKDLVKSAYAIKEYELAGPPWMDAETFAIEATMPPSTTKEQFRFMLQNLLTERFRMSAHRETREILAYSLVVAKNGPKLSRAGSIPATATGPDGTPITVADQILQRPGSEKGSFVWTGLRSTMSQLADKLAR